MRVELLVIVAALGAALAAAPSESAANRPGWQMNDPGAFNYGGPAPRIVRQRAATRTGRFFARQQNNQALRYYAARGRFSKAALAVAGLSENGGSWTGNLWGRYVAVGLRATSFFRPAAREAADTVMYLLRNPLPK